MPDEYSLQPLKFNDRNYDDLATAAETKHGLPTGILRALKNAGERSDNHQISPAKAAGVMQFIPETGARYGVTDFHDPVQSIDAAGRYVKDIMGKLKTDNPALIAAAYNAGENHPALMAGKVPNIPETQAYAVRVNNFMRAQPKPATAEGEYSLEPVTAPAPDFSDVRSGVAKPPPPEKGLLRQASDAHRDFSAGVVRGAGSIGSTLVTAAQHTPVAMLLRAAGVDTGRPDAERRTAIDEGLRSLMGVDPQSTAYGAGKLGGEIAGTAGAGGLIGQGLKAVPGLAAAAPRVIQAIESAGMTTGSPAPATLGQAAREAATRIAGGAISGGAQAGLVDPSQTGMGAAIGAALPAVVKPVAALARGIGGAARAAVEPFYESGQQRIIGRLYNRAAGTPADAAAAQANLAAARELVPGSLPTAGQASGNAGIAALERTASAVEPSATQAFTQRATAQNQARVDALESVAGEPGKKAFFEADRAAAADKLYNDAYEKGMDLNRHPETGKFLSKAEISGRKGEINNLLKRPAIQSAIDEARTLAQNEGVKMTDMAGSVKGLDYVQRALGDQISKATGNEKRILVNLRDRLLTTIDALSPKYAAARTTFREMSKPINQMDIGEEIANKSINKLTGNLQPQAFARSLTDDTARRATGFNGSTLENTLDPAHIATLNAIRDDVARSTFAQNAGRGPGSDTVQKLAYSNVIDGAGIPTYLRAIPSLQTAGNMASRGADALYGRANRELAAKLAESGLNPQQVAAAMQAAAQPGGGPIVQMLLGTGGSQIARRAAIAALTRAAPVAAAQGGAP